MSIHTPEDYAECDRAFAKLKAELVDVRASWKAAEALVVTYRTELVDVKAAWEACSIREMELKARVARDGERVAELKAQLAQAQRDRSEAEADTRAARGELAEKLALEEHLERQRSEAMSAFNQMATERDAARRLVEELMVAEARLREALKQIRDWSGRARVMADIAAAALINNERP